MASSTANTALRLSITCLGAPVTFTIPFDDNDSNHITSTSTILQIKERIASMDIEELGESYPVECQRLYHNFNHFLSDDNRTLDSYGLSGSNIILHLGRSSKRRKITVTTTTATNAVPAPNPNAVVETETLPARSHADVATATEVESPERPRRALISYRRADELFDHLQARMALLREMQNAQMMRRSQSQKLNVMVTRLLEGCSEISEVMSMTPDACAEHVLNGLCHPSLRPSPDTPDLNQACVICNEDFSKCNLYRNPIVKTNCQHFFHRQCLKKWMIASDNLTCPLCRSRVSGFTA